MVPGHEDPALEEGWVVLLRLTEFVPFRVIKTNGQPPCWGQEMKRRIRTRERWTKYEVHRTHRKYKRYRGECNEAQVLRQKENYLCIGNLARNIKINPKAYCAYAQSERRVRDCVAAPERPDRKLANRIRKGRYPVVNIQGDLTAGQV